MSLRPLRRPEASAPATSPFTCTNPCDTPATCVPFASSDHCIGPGHLRRLRHLPRPQPPAPATCTDPCDAPVHSPTPVPAAALAIFAVPGHLVPVVTATFPVDPSCQYGEGSFLHFKGLVDSIIVMNGINAPKVIECLGSDGRKYCQLAKSGNDDLRQDVVTE